MTTADFQHPTAANHYAALVLFSDMPSPDDIRGLFGEFEFTETAPGVMFDFEIEKATVQLLFVAKPYPLNSGALPHHPVFCAEQPQLEQQQAHCIISAKPKTAEPLGWAYYIGTFMTSALASMYSAVAVIDPVNECAWGPGTYQDIFEEDREQMICTRLWSPVWVDHQDGSFVCTTRSLAAYGHAELQVTHTTAELDEAFGLLMNMAQHVLSGGQLHPGDPIAYNDTTVDLTIEPWVQDDTKTAITVKL